METNRERTLATTTLSRPELLPIQHELMRLLTDTGASNGELARKLYISPNTVKGHLQMVFRHLGVQNRTAAVMRYRSRYPSTTGAPSNR